MSDTLIKWKSIKEHFIALRQQIHSVPETAMLEFKTSAKMAAEIEALKPDRLLKLATTGLIASVYPKKNDIEQDKGILFRAELDALPIVEKSDLPYTSTIAENGHLCGHDGHMVMLLATFKYATELRDLGLLKSAVHFLFQPAEENGAGAKAVLEDPKFDLKPDFTFALHNIPGVELGKLLTKEGIFTPEVISVIFSIEGYTSHAAQPHLGKNPAPVIADIIQFMQEIHSYKSASKAGLSSLKDGDVVVAPVYIEMGQEDYGISAGKAKVGYTFRTMQPNDFEATKEKITAFAEHLAKKYGIAISLDWDQYFAANVNDTKASKIVHSAFSAAKLSVQPISSPFEWGEDFGIITQTFKGTMFGLGSGENTRPLHNPSYNFPDELLVFGVHAFLSIILQYNKLDMNLLNDVFA
jgi:amidohydrolase